MHSPKSITYLRHVASKYFEVMRFVLLHFFALLFIPLESPSQQLYRKIATREVQKKLMEEYPEMKYNARIIEQHTAEFVRNGRAKQVTIPVIFHIILSDSSELVSETQVLSQLAALNRDFRNLGYQIRHPADSLEQFTERVADTEINFCLSNVIDSVGNPMGIHFVHTTVQIWNSNDSVKYGYHDGTDVIAPENVLNVWVCHLQDSISGYAQMPGGASETDGIVIDYRFFGTQGTAQAPYNEGKTLTHLIGNYLNLFDLWGMSLCSDDYVEDTPIHNAPNYGCPGYRHVSTCQGNPVEQTMNFMDNSNDACMYMFTVGQKMRMQATIAEGGPRANLAIGGTSVCADTIGLRSTNTLSFQDRPVMPSAPPNPSVNVFPNPASGEINLMIYSGNEGSASISVYNTLGSTIYLMSPNLVKGGQQFSINCNTWAEGPYFLKVQSSWGIASKLFFIKRQ